MHRICLIYPMCIGAHNEWYLLILTLLLLAHRLYYGYHFEWIVYVQSNPHSQYLFVASELVYLKALCRKV